MKQTSQHTPGPWRSAGKLVVTDMPSGSQHICKISNGVLADYAEANAHLIASAPDLFGALQAAASQLRLLLADHETIHNESTGSIAESYAVERQSIEDTIALAERAITKAEGRS